MTKKIICHAELACAERSQSVEASLN